MISPVYRINQNQTWLAGNSTFCTCLADIHTVFPSVVFFPSVPMDFPIKKASMYFGDFPSRNDEGGFTAFLKTFSGMMATLGRS